MPLVLNTHGSDDGEVGPNNQYSIISKIESNRNRQFSTIFKFDNINTKHNTRHVVKDIFKTKFTYNNFNALPNFFTCPSGKCGVVDAVVVVVVSGCPLVCKDRTTPATDANLYLFSLGFTVDDGFA